jgi:putative transcriptional regulator
MSKIGQEIIDGLKEALAHAQGDDVPGIGVRHVDIAQVDTKAIRKKLRLTQEQMALALGTSPSGYRKWEQGQRQPSGAAKTLLRVMEKEPEAVRRALSAK